MDNSQNAKPVTVDEPARTSTANQVSPVLLNLRFTASGAEYFKIWLSNLCLSLLTLGLYTPWAKCRRMQYLARHTWLDEHQFDFRANPWRILLGRLVILGLLFLVTWRDYFSKPFVTGLLILLILATPLLLRSAIRFRLQNTYYRGIPFCFTGNWQAAMLSYLPLTCYLFVVPLLVLYGYELNTVTAWQIGIFMVLWPMVLIYIKRYQHNHICYGNLTSRFTASMWPVYGYYLLITVIAITQIVGLSVIWLIIHTGLGKGKQAFLDEWLGTGQWFHYSIFGLIVIAMWLVYLFIMPFWHAKMWNHIWSHTEINGQYCQPDYRVKQVFVLMLKNSLLTLLSLGFYRPFAVIAWQRYRISHLALPAQDWQTAAAPVRSLQRGQDGLVDGLNLDFSW